MVEAAGLSADYEAAWDEWTAAGEGDDVPAMGLGPICTTTRSEKRTLRSMVRYMSVTEARQRFLELADSLDDEPLYVTRRGKPVLAIVRPVGLGPAPATPAPSEVVPTGPGPDAAQARADRARRLELFDRATARLRSRPGPSGSAPRSRGWTRDDLYDDARGDR